MDFRENRLLQSWDAGRATINGWIAIPSAISSEAMASVGWDSLTVDMQHGLIDYSDLVNILIAVSTTPVVPMVRVPWLEEGIIMKSLDAGAYGVICPMINTADDAWRFASACKYPPTGSRSVGPIRAKLYAGSRYVQRADDSTIAIAMIETREAMHNIESILSAEGLDGIYIGPSDLSISLGLKPGFDSEEPTVLSSIEFIIQTTKRFRKRVGVHTATVSYAQRMVDMGADFVTVGSDMRLLLEGAQTVIDSFRAAVGRGQDSLIKQ